MSKRAATVFVIASSLWTSPALAAALEVRDAWVNATVPGQSVAAAYATLQSTTAQRVVAIRSNVSNAAAIHSMSLENGVMRMRHVDNLAVPAGQVVTLAPGGLHLMLSGVQRPLNIGEVVELEFTVIDDAGTKTSARVKVPVRQEVVR